MTIKLFLWLLVRPQGHQQLEYDGDADGDENSFLRLSTCQMPTALLRSVAVHSNTNKKGPYLDMRNHQPESRIAQRAWAGGSSAISSDQPAGAFRRSCPIQHCFALGARGS